MYAKYRSCLFLFLFITFDAFSQRIINFDSSQEIILQSDNFSVFEDTSGKFTIKDVTKPEFNPRFEINTKSNPFNENINSAYWIKFSIIHKTDFDKSFCLESYSPHTEDFRLYLENEDGWIEKRSGQSLYFYDREFKNKNLIFQLPLKPNEVQTFYVRVQSSNYCSFDFRIKQFSQFVNYNTNEYFFLGTYYGILLIMALYNLMMYFSIREDIYIYYVLYVFAGILSTLTEDCLGYQFVWFKFPELNTPIGHHLAPSLLLLTFILYSRKFLKIKELLPKYDSWIILSTLCFFAYYILHLTVLPDYLYFRSIYLIPFILVYLSSIKIFINGYKPARFFIIGYTIIFISIIIIQLRANGTIGGNLLTVYSLNYGLVMEILVLSFAMADRIKFIKKEKEEALYEKNDVQRKIIEQFKINEELKDKVNRELEEKVVARTIELNQKNTELEEANGKLKLLSDQAREMSVKLDLDNWNLQKNIKESIKDRLAGKEVGYEEFNKIFPDESACYRYLEEVKWNDPFKCRKCGNIKYINGVKVFSRKCTKCGYPESVTAFTLFHGIRFPLNKAFYMTYLIHRKNKITLDELSDLMELRRNTCWSFKKKVLQTIDNYQKIKKKPLDNWEELILLYYI